MALDERGKLFAWGDGTYGELGDDEIQLSETPRKIAYFDNKGIRIKSMAVGLRHSSVLDEDGKIYTFGDNSST
jgi:alpha-tubulin suppressor-like RCC1 family protein